jgi:hypothetical protein
MPHLEHDSKMPKALILVADGSEEMEFVTPYDGTSPHLCILFEDFTNIG